MRARIPLLLLLLGILFLAAVSLTYGEDVEEEWRGGRRSQDPEERERVRQREDEKQREERRRRSEKEEQQQERGSHSQSRRSSSCNNPFYFPRSRFQTLYRSQQGRIRVLERFDRRSNKLENLKNYRIVEFEAKPNSIVLPHHSDAEYILVVQQGNATVHLANPDDRESFNLERGHALRISAGTTSYIVNRNDNQNLRIVKLAIPVNRPGKFDDFFPASNEDQQSYFRGFSRSTLEAALNAPFEEIQRTLLEENEDEEEGQHHQGSQGDDDEGVIVKVSKEQIQELTKHDKSSRGSSSQSSRPFNLRSRRPIYESNFGRLFEVTPERNPQLEDLDIFLSCVEIKEGGLMLPHFNSKAIVVLVVNQGKGKLELVALRDENQQQQQEEEEEEEDEEDEGNKRVHRYTVRLSRGDVIIIPAGHPVAINASSDLHLLAFGINAENNQRNFLAGENDNVLNQIHRQVKELAFPGSGEQVERLFKRQSKSYFVSAQPQQEQQREDEGRRGPLLSILGAFN